MLTPRMAKALSFIRVYSDTHGYGPSFIEMQEGLGLASKSGIHRLLKALEERGHIRRLRHRARAIEVIDDPTLQDDLSGHSIHSLATEAKRRHLVLCHRLNDNQFLPVLHEENISEQDHSM